MGYVWSMWGAKIATLVGLVYHASPIECHMITLRDDNIDMNVPPNSIEFHKD